MDTKRLALIPALLTAGVLAACGGDEPAGSERSPEAAAAQAAPAAPRVTIKTFQFQPDPVEVEAGQAVEFVNEDSAIHTVTAGSPKKPDGAFDHRLRESGGSAKVNFDEPGTFRYFCSLHDGPGMQGEVVVR